MIGEVPDSWRGWGVTGEDLRLSTYLMLSAWCSGCAIGCCSRSVPLIGYKN
jgi:hypothetical protein